MDWPRRLRVRLDALASRILPREAADYTTRALDRHLSGDLAGAIADYTRALARYQHLGDRAFAYISRGNARRSAGDLLGATADYDRAIELQPGHAGAYLSRGVVHLEQGHREQAIADFRMVRELSADPRWRAEAEEQLRALETESFPAA